MIPVLFTITTDASGDYSATKTEWGIHGPMLLYAVEWVDTDFDAGVDAVLSMTGNSSGTDKTLLTLTNADAEAWYYPWSLVVKNDGSTAATDFFAPQVVEGSLKLVVSAGGNTKTGKCVVYLKCA